MMTIDYALIRLSLWLSNLQPPDFEWLIGAGFALAMPFTLIIAAVYAARTIRATGFPAFAHRLPALVLQGFGVFVVSPMVTVPLVVLAELAVFVIAGMALEAIAQTQLHMWTIWHALGGAR